MSFNSFNLHQLVAKILTGGIVLVFVLLIVIHVDTQMDCVLVKPGGWIQIAAQVIVVDRLISVSKEICL